MYAHYKGILYSGFISLRCDKYVLSSLFLTYRTLVPYRIQPPNCLYFKGVRNGVKTERRCGHCARDALSTRADGTTGDPSGFGRILYNWNRVYCIVAHDFL